MLNQRRGRVEKTTNPFLLYCNPCLETQLQNNTLPLYMVQPTDLRYSTPLDSTVQYSTPMYGEVQYTTKHDNSKTT